MSEMKGKVGPIELNWKKIPRGNAGQAQVEVKGALYDVRWRRDADGIWIELPHGTYGFDFEGEMNDEGRKVYRVSQRSSDRTWPGLAFLRAGEQESAAAAGGQKKGMRVRAQMPGKIIRVLAAQGATVAKDQPLAVMEAMKMENEIRAPQAGKLGTVKVTEGQAVETGADLFVIDPE